MSKKTFYIILIAIAGILIIGGLIWYFFFRPPAPAVSPQVAGFTAPGQKTAIKNLTPISEIMVIFARFSGDDILFYDFSGKFWQYKKGDSKPAPIEQSAVENPDKITETESAVFSPDNKKIVYQISDSKNNSLFTSDSDGKNQKTLIKYFKLRDIVISWPKTSQIAFASKPSGLVAGSLWVLNTKNLSTTKLIGNLFGLEALFSPDGENFMYSYTNQNGQNPRIAAYRKNVPKNIGNVSTLIDKCAWAGDSINIYCAVPKSWPDSLTLPDDYYKNAFATMDNLWKINTETGEKNLIFQDMGDISNIELSPDGNRLIFISRTNQFLYQLNLK